MKSKQKPSGGLAAPAAGGRQAAQSAVLRDIRGRFLLGAIIFAALLISGYFLFVQTA